MSVKRGSTVLPLQWNPSIAATVREWHFGYYTEVAVVEGFRVLRILVHEKLKKRHQLLFVQRYMYVHVGCCSVVAVLSMADMVCLDCIQKLCSA